MSEKFISKIDIDGKSYSYYDIKKFSKEKLEQIPYSLRVLLENLMRHQTELGFDDSVLEAVADRENKVERPSEIPFHPERVLMQDFTGVPAIVDLAALRDAVKDEIGRASCRERV